MTRQRTHPISRHKPSRGASKRRFPGNPRLPIPWKRYSLISLSGLIGIFSLTIFGLALWNPAFLPGTGKLWVHLTHWAGFDLRTVYVIGREKTPSEAILQAIDVKIGDPLFQSDLQTIRQSVEQIPPVKTAFVERRLEGSLVIRVTERIPRAVWQQSGHYHLVDHEGVTFDFLSPSLSHPLPVLIGSLAPGKAPFLFAALEQAPEIGAQTIKAINHHGRRWDLQLQDGLILQLPETGMTESLRRINALKQEYDLQGTRIRSIDLRTTDRIIIDPARPPTDTASQIPPPPEMINAMDSQR